MADRYFLSHLYAKNWRNFSEIDLDLPRKKMVIVGANASGKSNFLDIMRFMHDIVKDGGGIQKSIKSSERGGSLDRIRFIGYNSNDSSDIILRFTLQDYRDKTNELEYFLQFGYAWGGNQQSKNILVKREYLKDLKTGQFLGDDRSSPKKPSEDDKELYRDTFLEQSSQLDFRVMRRFFLDIFYLHVNPLSVKYRQVSDMQKKELDPYGANFLEIIGQATEKQRSDFLARSTKALRSFIPNLEEIIFSQEGGVSHLEMKMDYSHRTQIQNELLMSDGTLRLLGIFWAIFEKSTKSSIILIEEPEISLNPGIVEFLPRLIHQLQRNQRLQVIITTHSDDMLSEPIMEEDVFLIKNSDSGSSIVPLMSYGEVAISLKSGFTLQEIGKELTKSTFTPLGHNLKLF